MPEIDLNKLNQYVNFLKTHLFFSDCEQPYDIASKKHTCVNKGDEIFLLRGYNGDIVGSFIYGEGTFSDEVYNILKPKPIEPPYSLPNGFVPVEVEEEWLMACGWAEDDEQFAHKFADRVAAALTELYPIN